MSFMNSSSNSTHGKRTNDLPNMNRNLTGPPSDEFAGVSMMSQGTNNTYAAPPSHGQGNLIYMDQYMGNAQSWGTDYVRYDQPAQWMNPIPAAYPVAEASSNYKLRSGKHPCPQCGSSFPTPSALSTHFRTHTGEKPFTCKICNKQFSVASNLRRHERTHVASSAFEKTDATGNVKSAN